MNCKADIRIDHCGWFVIGTEWAYGRDRGPRECPRGKACKEKLTQPIPDGCWHLSVEYMADDTSGRGDMAGQTKGEGGCRLTRQVGRVSN